MLILPLLSFLILIPLISVLIILIIPNKYEKQAINIKVIGIITSIVHLSLVSCLCYFFNKISIDYQFVENITIIPYFSFGYSLGIDGISLMFIFIASLLSFFILTFAKITDKNVKLFTVSLLLILSFAVGTFASTDILLFYLFYEMSMIPVFIIIGKLGSKDNIYVSLKYMIYNLFGSIFILIAIIVLITSVKSSSFKDITDYLLSFEEQKYLFLAFFIGLAIKSALFPFHTWLVETYASSPYELNILFSGVLIKYGIYGMIRILLYIFPTCVVYFFPYIVALALIGMFNASLLALQQPDFKRFFACFSIAQVSLIIAAIFSVNILSIEGALFQSFSHSIYNAGILLTLLFLNSRYNTTRISEFSGLAKSMPKLSICFMFIALASISLPLTNGFIGELLMLLGIFEKNSLLAIAFAFSMILSAIIIMYFNKKVIFGESSLYLVADIKVKEISALVIIILIILITGIAPNIILDNIHTTSYSIIETFNNIPLYFR